MREKETRILTISSLAFFSLALLFIIAIAMPAQAVVTDRYITFTNRTMNDTGDFIQSTKLNGRSVDVTVCRGTSTFDDIVKRFTCDYVCTSSDTDCSDEIQSAITNAPAKAIVYIKGDSNIPVLKWVNVTNEVSIYQYGVIRNNGGPGQGFLRIGNTSTSIRNQEFRITKILCDTAGADGIEFINEDFNTYNIGLIDQCNVSLKYPATNFGSSTYVGNGQVFIGQSNSQTGIFMAEGTNHLIEGVNFFMGVMHDVQPINLTGGAYNNFYGSVHGDKTYDIEEIASRGNNRYYLSFNSFTNFINYHAKSSVFGRNLWYKSTDVDFSPDIIGAGIYKVGSVADYITSGGTGIINISSRGKTTMWVDSNNNDGDTSTVWEVYNGNEVGISLTGNSAFSVTGNKTTLGSINHSACLQLRDTDNAGWTYCTVLNGVMNCSTSAC